MPPFSEAGSEGKERKQTLTVEEGGSGRLDAWLAGRLQDDFSRSRIKSLINEGAVSINGSVASSASRKVAEGDSVTIALPEATDPEPRGEPIPLTVLYEDDDLIVIDKPPGLVVHPGAGNWTGTLVNALIQHCGDSLSGIGGVRRPGIVHRLDKDTSGVMVAAKNDAAHRSLAAQFADHGLTGALERAYLALVWGQPRTLKGTIDAPLGRARDRLKRAVRHDDGDDVRHAVTHYTVMERYGEKADATSIATLVECRLETGRTHQIRVHMAHIGHPLIGDTDYGASFRTKANALPQPQRAAVETFTRQALHAYVLAFDHPATGETMRFETVLPDDFARLCDSLRQM